MTPTRPISPRTFRSVEFVCFWLALVLTACSSKEPMPSGSGSPLPVGAPQEEGHPNVRAAYISSRQAEAREQIDFHFHDESGAPTAHNRAQAFGVDFADDRVEIVHMGGWRLGLRTARLFCDERAVEVELGGARVVP